jgi:hypothetical protein
MNARRVAVVSIALGLAGCFMIQGHAEMVKRERGGGVLALRGDRDKAMADARSQMAANCPTGYEIASEEMVKVGEKTEGAEDMEFKKQGSEKNTSSVTADVQEYRVTYECTGANAHASSGGHEAG